MRFQIEAKALSDALTKASRIVATRNTYPILANAKITAGEDYIEIRTTDLDIELTQRVPAVVVEPGETTVPARTASDIAKKLGPVEMSFEMTGDRALMKAGRSRFELQVLPVDGFPEISVPPITNTLSMPGLFLATALSKVEFAISNEETRYYLNGVYVHSPSDGEIRFVATDGHRLAKLSRQIDGAYGMPGIIIPKKTVSEITKILDSEASVKFEVSDTRIRLTAGAVTLVSKLIEGGSFPDYERVMPRDTNVVAVANRKELITISDRVGTLSSERGGKAVKLSFAGNSLTLNVTSPDHGTAEDAMDVQYDADAMDIGFNARYLNDVLTTFSGDDVNLHLKDAGSPALINSASDSELTCVLMPMRI